MKTHTLALALSLLAPSLARAETPPPPSPPKPFTVPAEGVVDYQFYTIDPGWKTDKWIQTTEARPGNRAVVHHIIVFVQPKEGGDAFGRGGLGGYAPGTPPNNCPPGTAIHVPAGSKLADERATARRCR